MKREKRRGQKEEMHGMNLHSLDDADREQDYDEEKKRHRPKRGDLAGERPRLELLRHGDRYVDPRNEPPELPAQQPAVTAALLLRGRDRAFREIDRTEVRAQIQAKIAHLGDSLAEAVGPAVE